MKKYKVINSFPGESLEQHDYNIIREDTKYGVKHSLIRSQGDHWSDSAKGKTVVVLLDDGNGIKMSKHIQREMNYDTAAELLILLSFINKPASNGLYTGTIEEVNTIIVI